MISQTNPRALWHRISGYEAIGDIFSGGRPYLHRWRLLSLPNGRRLYLHHFVRSDSQRDLHDHPKTFISIGLLGGYVEETPHGRKRFVAPFIRKFPPEHLSLIHI